MTSYRCAVCGKEIKSFNDGLFVKIKDSKGNVLKVVPVHKEDCDETLCRMGEAGGLNTNSSMEISFFDTEEERNAYLNGTFVITDEQFYQKFFNEDGTLKLH